MNDIIISRYEKRLIEQGSQGSTADLPGNHTGSRRDRTDRSLPAGANVLRRTQQDGDQLPSASGAIPRL